MKSSLGCSGVYVVEGFGGFSVQSCHVRFCASYNVVISSTKSRQLLEIKSPRMTSRKVRASSPAAANTSSRKSDHFLGGIGFGETRQQEPHNPLPHTQLGAGT